MVIEDAVRFRPKEQVLADLAKALHFSTASLEQNRGGKLSTDQFKQLIGRCARSAVMIIACFLAPFLIWTPITAARQQVSFDAGFSIFAGHFMHVGDLIASQGKFGALTELGSTVILIGLAVYLS